MFISSTYRITGLHHTYRWVTLSVASFSNLYLQNYWVTLHILVSSLKCSPFILGLLTESLDYTRLMDAPPEVQPMFVSSTYRTTGLHYTNGCPTLRAAYVCKLELRNRWVTLLLLVSKLKCSIFFVYFTWRNTRLTYTNGCPTSSGAYVCMFYLQNHWVTLHLWVYNRTFSLSFLGSTYRITGLYYTYGCQTLSAAFVG